MKKLFSWAAASSICQGKVQLNTIQCIGHTVVIFAET